MPTPNLPTRILLNTGVLRRRVILRVAYTGRPLMRASSVLVLDRLDGPAREAMLGGGEPIGRVLRGAALDTRRELLPYTVDVATADDAAELEIAEGTTIFERSYRILTSDRALADGTERIPATLFDPVGA